MCFKTRIINIYVYTMSVPPNLLPSHSEKTLGAMKAERTVKRITFNPTATKVKVTVNDVPNRVYNEGISGRDMWKELTRHFNPHSKGWPNMTPTKYLTANKFGLWIDLRSMADTTMHGNGQRLVNTQNGVQLEIERTASGSGITNCYIFTVSDSQMNIMERQLIGVQY